MYIYTSKQVFTRAPDEQLVLLLREGGGGGGVTHSLTFSQVWAATIVLCRETTNLTGVQENLDCVTEHLNKRLLEVTYN